MSAPNGTFEDGYAAGQLRERVNEHGRRLDAINGSIDRAEQAISELRTEVQKLAVRVGVYAAVAAFVAAIGGSLLVTVLTK